MDVREQLDEYIVTDVRPTASGEGSLLDITWPIFIEWGGPNLTKLRDKQLAQLGRYGRQSMRGWEEEELAYFLRCYNAVMELVASENSLSRAGENNG